MWVKPLLFDITITSPIKFRKNPIKTVAIPKVSSGVQKRNCLCELMKIFFIALNETDTEPAVSPMRQNVQTCYVHLYYIRVLKKKSHGISLSWPSNCRPLVFLTGRPPRPAMTRPHWQGRTMHEPVGLLSLQFSCVIEIRGPAVPQDL